MGVGVVGARARGAAGEVVSAFQPHALVGYGAARARHVCHGQTSLSPTSGYSADGRMSADGLVWRVGHSICCASMWASTRVRTSSPKPPSVTEVWPVTTLRGSTFASGGVYRDAAGPAGLNLNASLNPRFAGTGKFSAGVLRALLYCHGLVIEDPIIVAADMYTGTKAELRAVARLAVVSAVTSIVEIAPLLDSDVVRTFFSSGQELRNVQDLRAAIGGKLSEAGAAFTAQS
jgi:hypothetical protein